MLRSSSTPTAVVDDEESSFESDGSTLVEWDDNEYDADDEQSEVDSSDESDGDSSDESSIATVDYNNNGGWVALVDEDFVLSNWIDEAFKRCPP
ncbi:hypothetical protein PFICI_05572 [Pestalotiopsis fici W106-1]|uniref:Uncharacterized protein n=1 Tax=Pestalotiopsis fici (strain W106-1 / CGMCC3.15140) TaxID=1229662 RepID=W3XET0_PESFW|nr:uncharacterized protein PFICI_05572 [Pestalotiopsis fici W106-1]ETS83696.1 hypothetical protein PFICI_05572 [Pestalotiopsis fici W106-1]